MLIAHGARTILVPLVPDIGVAPGAIAAGAGAAGTLLAQTYNTVLQAAIGGLGSVPGLDVLYLDTFALVDAVVANPGGSGFSNVTAPCYIGPFTGGGSVCATPDLYLFWDQDHPTAAGHAAIAAAAARAGAGTGGDERSRCRRGRHRTHAPPARQALTGSYSIVRGSSTSSLTCSVGCGVAVITHTPSGASNWCQCSAARSPSSRRRASWTAGLARSSGAASSRRR